MPQPVLDLSNVRLAELRRRLSSFRRMDLPKANQAQVDGRVARLLDQFPLFREELTINRVMRARPNLPGQIFQHRTEIWYPPADKSRLNRLNDAGEVMFYCADAAFTALNEVSVGPGTVATLIHCATRRPFEILPMVFLGASVASSPIVNKDGYWSRRSNLEADLGPSRFHKYQLIDKWLTDLITAPVGEGEEHRYRPSVGFAHLLLKSPVKVVHYPSVKTGFTGLNLAMPPEIADATLRPHEAWMIEFGARTDLDGRSVMPVVPIRRSYPIRDDGRIVWRPDGEGFDDFEKVLTPPPHQF